MTNRRELLIGGAGLLGLIALAPEQALAQAAAPWTVGWADVEADIAPRRMRRISGRAPAWLEGTLYRNGPAKFRRPGASATHWFDGDGLVRSFRLGEGEATLAARFVDTPKRRQEAAADAMIVPGFGTPGRADARIGSADDANAANTSVLPVGGDVWALWEGGSPFAVDGRTLETRGAVTLGENLAGTPFLAHPRVEPDGTVWNLGVMGGRAVVWKLSRDGALQSITPVALPRASYLHDFTATRSKLVIVLQPWFHTVSRPPFVEGLRWRPDEGTQVLVLDKADLSQRRTYDLPAFSFFHLGDAWEDGQDIRFDVCAAPDPAMGVQGARDVLLGRTAHGAGNTRLAQAVLRANGASELIRTDSIAEFPQSDPRRAGLPRRFTAHAAEGVSDVWASAVAVRDWRDGREAKFDFGRDHLVEEHVYVPAPGREAEEDGYLLGTTVNLRARATELHLFRLARVSDGPVASWRADVALPIGFHGRYAPGARG